MHGSNVNFSVQVFSVFAVRIASRAHTTQAQRAPVIASGQTERSHFSFKCCLLHVRLHSKLAESQAVLKIRE